MSTRSSTSKTTKQDLAGSVDLESRIRTRAYEFYLERGGIDGYSLDDWLKAEAEITAKKAKSTAA